MLIAIISDIHDNLANLERFLNWASTNAIEKIVCCGDVTNFETINFLATNFSKEIFLVRGNAEIYQDDELLGYENIVDGGRTAIFEIGGKKVGVCHEPFLIKEVFAKGRPDIIFYGHTHKPWIEESDGVQIANPGTLGGVFMEATFAVFDTLTGKLDLKVLNNLKFLRGSLDLAF